MALAKNKHAYGLKTVAEMMVEGQEDTAAGDDCVPDELFEMAGAEFLGMPTKCRSGVKFTDNDIEQVRVFLKSPEGKEYVYGHDDDGNDLMMEITDADVIWDDLRVYCRANKRNDEILHSRMYLKDTARANFFVKMCWPGDGDYIGRIDRFLRVTGVVTLEDGDMPFTLRIAVCDWWPVKHSFFDGDILEFRMNEQWEYARRDALDSGSNQYPVLVSKIDYKVNVALQANDNHAYALRPFCASRRL